MVKMKIDPGAKDLAEENEKLRQALKAGESLVNNVIHEIRNPLHAVCNISEYILSNLSSLDEKSLKNYLEYILKNSVVVKDLTEELLDYAKIKSDKGLAAGRSFYPEKIVKEAIEECNALYLKKPDITIEKNSLNEFLRVPGDSAKIKSVVKNLLVNALKYAGGKKITVKSVLSANDSLKISVSDEGPGIEEKELKNVFEPFVRLKKDSSKVGTGLGLSISKGIIENYGGTIWAENNEKGGATFSFTLPLAAQSVKYYEEA